MAELASAYVTLIPSLKGAQTSIEKQLGGINTSKAGKQMGASAGKGFGAGFGAIIGATAAVTQKAMSVISSSMGDAISRVDTMNNFPKIMSNLGISSEDASVSVSTLQDKLDGLPTTLDSATNGVTRFVSKNSDVGKSTDMFLAMNNAILAGGANVETQSAAIEQLTQAYAKGKLDMVEWRSLQQAMPAQINQIAQAMGMSADSLGEGLRDGSVSMDSFMDKIVELNETGVDGFASFEEQARSATGGIATQMTNLKTSVTRGLAGLLDAFGSDRFAMIITSLKSVISSAFSTIEPLFTRLGDVVERVFGEGGALSNTDEVLSNIASVVQNLAPVLGALLGVFAGFNPVIGVVVGLFGGMISVNSDFKDSLLDTGSRLVEAFAPLGETLSGVFSMIQDTMGETMQSLATSLIPVIEDIANTFIGLMPTIQLIVTLFGETLANAIRILGSVFQTLLPIITPLINIFAGLFAQALLMVVGLINQMLPIVAQLAEIFAPVIAKIGELVGVIAAALMPIIEQLMQIIPPIMEVIVLIAGAIADALLPIIDAVIGVIVALMPSIQSIMDIIVSSLVPAIMNLVEAIAPIIVIIGQVVGAIIGALAPVFDVIIQIIGTVIAAIAPLVDAFARIVQAVMPIVQAIAGFLIPIFTAAANIIAGILSWLMPLIEGVLGVVTFVVDGIAAAIGWVADTIGPVLDSVGQWFSDTFGGAAEDVDTSMTSIQDTVGSCTDAIASSTDSSLGSMESTWSSVLGSVEGDTSSFSSTQVGQFDSMMSDMTGSVGTGLTDIQGTFGTGFGDVEGAVTDSVSVASDEWGTGITGMSDATTAGVNQISVTMASLITNIKSAFSGAGSWLTSAGADIINGLIIGANSKASALNAALTRIANSAAQAARDALKVESPSRVFMEIGEFVMLGFIEGVKSLATSSKNVLSSIFKELTVEFSNSFDKTLKQNRAKLQSELDAVAKYEAKKSNLYKQIAALEKEQSRLERLASTQEKDALKATNASLKSVKAKLSALEKSYDEVDRLSSTVYDRAKSRLERILEDIESVNTLATDALSDALLGNVDSLKNKLSEIYSTMGTTGSSAVNKLGTQLTKAASQMSTLNTKLDDAKDKLAEAQQAMASYADSISSTFSADVKKVTVYTSAQDYLGQLQSRLSNARHLASKVKELAAMGMPQAIIDDILGLGIDDGLSAASALLNGMDANTAKNIIAATSDIDKISSALGTSLSKSYYQAGVNAAAGLVSGLESQKKTLEKMMKDLANTLVSTIKKSLQIKSPSKVFAGLGRFIPEGLAMGVDGAVKTAVSSVSDMSDRITEATRITVPEPEAPFSLSRNYSSGTTSSEEANLLAEMIELFQQFQASLPGTIYNNQRESVGILDKRGFDRMVIKAQRGYVS